MTYAYKTCPNCKINKARDQYHISQGAISQYCKECANKFCREYYNANKTIILINSKFNRAKTKDRRKNQQLQKDFKISIIEYNKLLKNQNFKCAGCGRHKNEFNKALAVDHCHKTGRIRGLLCQNCNTSLGLVKDKIIILLKLIKYLGISRMNIISILAPIINGIISKISNLLMGLFLVKTGEKQQQLEDFKNEDKQIKKSKTISEGINAMPDSELRDLMRNSAKRKKDE